MHDLHKLKELGNNINVLYVEDDDDIREHMHVLLELFFKKVVIAKDGKEGLEAFKANSIDLIVTDIQMPRMNGLDMIEEIKKIDPEITVIIETAFSEQEYFIRSINLKVDKYLIKPIQQEQAQDVLYTSCKMIDNKRKAKELERLKIQEKINRVSKRIISEVIDGYQNPCIIYTDNEIKYVNDTFCSLFDAEKLSDILSQNDKMLPPFDDKEGFMRSLKEYDDQDPYKNRVSISKQKGRKIYKIVRSKIYLDDDKKESCIYIFNDITLEEYQKIKIKAYAQMLEELVFNSHYRNKRSIKNDDKKKASTQKVKKEVKKIEKDSDKNEKKLVIEEEENTLLRRSHTFKTTASEYLEELDGEILQELQELDDLDKDFSDSIATFKDKKTIEGVHRMAKQLNGYAHVISLLFEFGDLAYAIRSISELLESLDANKLTDDVIKKMIIFLSGIQEDLASWRRYIFLEKSAIDIHYLDSSLFSACLQIELILSDEVKELESQEDDLILF